MCAGSSCESGEFASKRDASPKGRQPWAEHIRHVHQRRCLADGTCFVDSGADLAGGAHKFGVCVAHIGSIGDATSVVGESRGAGKPIVDMALTWVGVARRHSKDDASIVEAPVR